MSSMNIVLNIIPTIDEGYTVASVHRMAIMQNRPVSPGSIQGSHRPIGTLHDKKENVRTIACVKLSINNHLVCLV